jgi:hypothetical protein
MKAANFDKKETKELLRFVQSGIVYLEEPHQIMAKIYFTITGAEIQQVKDAMVNNETVEAVIKMMYREPVAINFKINGELVH